MPDENEEKIRQNQIYRLSLRLNAESTYFTIGAVILALIAIVISLFGWTPLGTVYVAILFLIVLATVIRQIRIYNQIDDFFPLLKK